MLNLWRRHSADCAYSRRKEPRRHKNCSCPIWVQGSLRGQWIKKSLSIRNWESAQKLVRELEAGVQAPEVMGVRSAFARFIASKKVSVGEAAFAKYLLLEREMAARFGDRPVDSVSVDELAKYRETWRLSGISARKKMERMRTFFKFCISRGWLARNPAKELELPDTKFKPTLPFTEDEMKKILAAVEKYPDRPAGRRAQLRAFLLLLRHSGLRITDAVCVSREKLIQGKLLLYTQKTGQPVWVPLPDSVIGALDGLPHRPFWSGKGLPKSAVADWQRSLGKLFRLCAIKGHAHRFRDTFAVNLLTRGVSIEDVSVLLGHASIKVTEKHYAPWVKVRQDRLEEAVRRAF